MNDQVKMKSAKKILAIDDEEELRKVLRDKLNLEGFRVLEAKDGEEGLKTALLERPDLILLDILMPKMNGLDMMKKLRQSNSWGKTVPIILLTNLDAHDENINRAVTEDTPAYYLVKANWSMEDVVAKIRARLPV
jgi:DNA-binding response OmpR family regulator